MNNSRYDKEKSKCFYYNNKHDIEGKKFLDDRGFSLLELLVSIIILILIMVPLMNNFVRSVKINDDAENIQDYSVVASNIVEDFRSMDMTQLLDSDPKYYGQYGIIYDEITHTSSPHPYTKNDVNQETYYFGMDGISGIDGQYNVLVTVDAGTDEYKKLAPTSTTKLNDNEMPEISAVNDTLNCMLLSDIYYSKSTNLPVTSSAEVGKLYNNVMSAGVINYDSLDRIAFNEFMSAADSYADEQFRYKSSFYANYLKALSDYELAISNGLTATKPSAPDRLEDSNAEFSNPEYCQSTKLMQWISRTSDIVISDEGDPGKEQTIVNYTITYNCKWPTGVNIDKKSISFIVLKDKKYGSLINNSYLYYQPSIFHDYSLKTGITNKDIINITNNAVNMMNFYVIKMSKAIFSYVDTAELNNTELNTNLIKYDAFASSYPEPTLDLHKNSNKLNIYTNLLNIVEYDINDNIISDINKGKIVSSSANNWIYSIKVQVFQLSNTDKYNPNKLLYTLDSSKDN